MVMLYENYQQKRRKLSSDQPSPLLLTQVCAVQQRQLVSWNADRSSHASYPPPDSPFPTNVVVVSIFGCWALQEGAYTLGSPMVMGVGRGPQLSLHADGWPLANLTGILHLGFFEVRNPLKWFVTLLRHYTFHFSVATAPSKQLRFELWQNVEETWTLDEHLVIPPVSPFPTRDKVCTL